MAFRALNWESMKEMGLNDEEVQDAFQAAVFVFFVQSVLIGILAIIVFTSSEGFSITLPSVSYTHIAIIHQCAWRPFRLFNPHALASGG